MDAMLRGKAEELAKEIAVSISIQPESSDMMRLMSKTVIERMPDAERDVHLGGGRSVSPGAAAAGEVVGRAAGEQASVATVEWPQARSGPRLPRRLPIAATAGRKRPCKANRASWLSAPRAIGTAPSSPC
jgi:hypothetical protein